MADEQDTDRPRKKPKRKGGRRERSLKGTHLFREVRTDNLVWRRTHPVTKERMTRYTGTDVLEYALVKAREFEDELAREVAGIKSYDGWTRELARWSTSGWPTSARRTARRRSGGSRRGA